MDRMQTAMQQGKRLGRAAFKVHLDGKSVLVKYQPKCKGILSHLTRQLVGGSLPFLNESRVNALLLNTTFHEFRFPRLITNHSPCYCSYEFIDNAIELDRRSSQEKSRCVRAILEFHMIRDSIRKPFWERILFPLLERPVYWVLRITAFRKCKILDKFKVFLIVLRYSISQRKLPGVYLHNDLAFSNIVLNDNNELVFLDFEDAVFEHKWILSDLVDVFFDVETLSLDIRGIEKAWHQLATRLGVDDRNALNFEAQIRVCLLKTSLFALRSRHERAYNKKMIKSFLRILLNSRQYQSWFRRAYGTT